MRVRPSVLWSFLILMLLVLGLLFLTSSSQFPSALWGPPPQNHATAGRVLAVHDQEFSLQNEKSVKAAPVRFVLDENTRIEGSLAPGARVAVEYLTEDGRNVAVHVVVAPVALRRHLLLSM
jgi:hypothetical protein